MQEEPTNINASHLLESIRKGELKMRPKWHFVLKTVLILLGAIILLLSILYLVSLIIFGLRETGVIFTPGFGMKGTILFFRSLPWVLIILVGVFLIILEILVRKYSFAYKTPLLYSAFVIVLGALMGGWIIARTPLHWVVIHRAPEFNIPLVGPMYRDIRYPAFKEIHTGKIVFITPRGFDMQNPRDEMIVVVMNPETRVMKRMELHVGDNVMVIGPRIGNTIDAFAVRNISGMK